VEVSIGGIEMKYKNFFILLIVFMIMASGLKSYCEQQPPTAAEELRQAVEKLASDIKPWFKEMPKNENLKDIVSFAYVNVIGRNRVPLNAWRVGSIYKFLKDEIEKFLNIWCYFPLIPKEDKVKKKIVNLRIKLNKEHYTKTLCMLTIQETAVVEAELDRSLKFIQLDKTVSNAVLSAQGFFIYDNKILGVNPAMGLSPVIVYGTMPDTKILSKWTATFFDMEPKAPEQTQPITTTIDILGRKQVIDVRTTFEALVSRQPSLGYYARLADKLKKKELSYEDVFKFKVLEMYH